MAHSIPRLSFHQRVQREMVAYELNWCEDELERFFLKIALLLDDVEIV